MEHPKSKPFRISWESLLSSSAVPGLLMIPAQLQGLTAAAAIHEVATSRRLLQSQTDDVDMTEGQDGAGDVPSASSGHAALGHAGPAARDHQCAVPAGSVGHACGSMFLDDGSQLEVRLP